MKEEPTQKIRERFENFDKALNRLIEVYNLYLADKDNSVFKDSLIQRFEFVTELSKNLQRDVLVSWGEEDMLSPKDIFSASFRSKLIDNYETWFQIIRSRNLSSHTYDEELAQKIVVDITEKFLPEFVSFRETIKQKYNL